MIETNWKNKKSNEYIFQVFRVGLNRHLYESNTYSEAEKWITQQENKRNLIINQYKND